MPRISNLQKTEGKGYLNSLLCQWTKTILETPKDISRNKEHEIV